jgi:dTDP-4-dehydrorhamnose reductase
MRILLTGASGQVGQALLESAPAGYELLTPGRTELDFSLPDSIPDCIRDLAPDTIINAAAYTAVDQAETDVELAQLVNETAAGVVADYCAKANIPLVHISTDYVFDGLSKTPYTPDSEICPLGVYARTKAAGEVQVQKRNSSAYIVRTGWLYGLHGSNFVKKMLQLTTEKEEISVVDDQVGTPTYSINLALMIWRLLAVMPAARIWHFSDAGSTSWYGFANAVFAEALTAGVIDKKPRVVPTRSADMKYAAPRPPFSVLDKEQTWSELNIKAIHWRKSLVNMLAEMASRR